MSIRRPPDRPVERGERGGPPARNSQPEYEAEDVAPDEVVDGDDGWTEREAGRTAERERADRFGDRADRSRTAETRSDAGAARGRAGVMTRPPASAPADGAVDGAEDTEAEEEAPSRPATRVVAPPRAPSESVAPPVGAVANGTNGAAVAAVAMDDVAADTGPALGEWLNRRWLFGLSYWQAILVGFFFVALIITRFFELGERAMHHDESMHAKFAFDTFNGQVYKYNPLLHGPFQFLAVAFSYWLFGATEYTARAVPAIFGVALVCLTFLWRRWLGTIGWLFAIGIFVFSPSFTYFARMLREDSYTATWTLLAATGFVGYVLHRKRPWFFAFCAGLSFAFATKESTYITAFIWGTFMILSLLWERGTTMQRRVIAGTAAGGVAGAYLNAVVGLGRVQLHEVGGAILGLILGALAGFAYHQYRQAPQRRAPAPRRPNLGTGAAGATGTASLSGLALPPRPRFQAAGRRERAAAAAGADGAPDRPQEGHGTFTRALVTLWQDKDGFWGLGTFWGGIVVFFVIFVLLFSSFFTNPGGLREGMIGSIRYWLEQHGVQRGNQPWYYYLLLLGVYETLAFVFGLIATVHFLRRPTWLTTFLIWWWVLALTIYSWAGEKMPWLIIHIATPLVLLTARYLGDLIANRTRTADGPVQPMQTQPVFGLTAPLMGGGGMGAFRGAWQRWGAATTFAVLSLWTIHTGWPVNFERPDTPKDLLVYTQTAPDVKAVMAEIERLSLAQTGDARALGVTVQSGTWWPFTWYLRDYKNVDYPSQLTAPATKPVVLIALEDDEKNRPYLQGYARTKYKMRWWYPEDYRSIPEQMQRAGGPIQYLSRKDVRDGLWKWLIYRETTQPLGSYDFYVYVKEGLSPSFFGAAGVGGADTGQASGAQRPESAVIRPNTEQYVAKTVPVNPIAQWGTQGRNPGQLNTPRAITTDPQGNIYVADTLNHRIQKFGRTGNLITAWGTEGNGDGQFKEPMGISVDAQGNVYVADTWNHRIQKFDNTGKFVTKWSGQGGFWGPRALSLDGQGNVYVTDTGNKRIQKFDNTGKFIAQFGTGGSGPGQFNEPIGLAVTPAGEIYVADTNNHRIQKLDATGKLLVEWPVAGWQGGQRNEPYLALDPEGNVYASDPPNGRVLKFNPQGEILAVAGAPGKAAGQFDAPLGITAGTGDALFVIDSANHRVQSIGLLR